MHGIARYTLRTTTRLRPSWCQGQAFEHNFIFHIFCKCSPGALYIYNIYTYSAASGCVGQTMAARFCRQYSVDGFPFMCYLHSHLDWMKLHEVVSTCHCPNPPPGQFFHEEETSKTGSWGARGVNIPADTTVAVSDCNWIAGTTILTMPSPVVWIRTMHDDVWRCSDAAQTILLSAGWFTCAGFGDGWDCLAKSLDG